VGLSYRTLMRWKRRLADGKDAVEKRGPKKVRPLNFAELKAKIRDLDHGPNAAAAPVRLHGAYADSISRRELNELVRQVRSDSNDPCQVDWLRTDLAWAMDGLEYRDCHVQNVQDLCSRYKFAPLTSTPNPAARRSPAI
jgi:transposase InsO family protein